MFESTTPATGARTDDLLASGAEPGDGADGFDPDARPEQRKTGMEGIAGTTAGQGVDKTKSSSAGISETVQDNPAQVRGEPGRQ